MPDHQTMTNDGWQSVDVTAAIDVWQPIQSRPMVSMSPNHRMVHYVFHTVYVEASHEPVAMCHCLPVPLPIAFHANQSRFLELPLMVVSSGSTDRAMIHRHEIHSMLENCAPYADREYHRTQTPIGRWCPVVVSHCYQSNSPCSCPPVDISKTLCIRLVGWMVR